MIAVAGGTRVQITIARHIENVHSVDNPRMALFDRAAAGENGWSAQLLFRKFECYTFIAWPPSFWPPGDIYRLHFFQGA
jgi:hypothetical protein